MEQQELRDALVELAVWLSMAGTGGLAVLLTWWRRPDLFHPLLPPQRHRAVPPWTDLEIALGFFVTFMVIPILAQGLLIESGLFTSHKVDRARLAIWGGALAFPGQILTTLWLFLRPDAGRLYQLGLAGTHAARSVVLAFLTWLWLSVSVFIFYALVVSIYIAMYSVRPDSHLFTELATGPWADRVAMFLAAVVAAPIVEELYFRGILQRWAGRSRRACTIVVAAAPFFALRLDRFWLAAKTRTSSEIAPLLLEGVVPALFILTVLFLKPVFRKLFRNRIAEPHAQAIFATSLLFAAVHSPVWPSPIALFPLSLGLGWLAYRTQSVFASATCHGLFNMISAIALLLTQQETKPQPVNGKDETTAAWRLPSTSTSTAVPALSCPRRTYASAIVPRRGDTTADVTWPTSLSSRQSLAPGAKPQVGRRRPRSARLTWPRSRARTIGSWPRKQPFV